MDESVLKFTKYLKDKIQKNEKELNTLEILNDKSFQELEQSSKLNKEIIILKNLIEILEIPRMKWPRFSRIFNDFDVLSYYLETSSLSAKESTDIIFYLIIKNLSTNLLENQSLIIDSVALTYYPFKKITELDIQKILYEDGIHTLLKKDTTNITLEEYEKQQEFLTFVKNHCLDIETIKKQHLIIQNHYLNKLTYFNEIDIEQVILALRNLKVSKTIIKKVNYILKQKHQKRNQKLSAKTISFSWEPQNTSQEKLLTNKEYKQIKKELYKYYNLKKHQVAHPLSFEEMIECLSLLLKLGMEQSQIETILKKINISRKHDKTDFQINLEEELERLRFYEETCSITEEIQNIEQYIKEMNQAKDQNERKIWKNFLVDELTNLKEFLSQDKRYKNYEYEIHCAKNLLKRKRDSN